MTPILLTGFANRTLDQSGLVLKRTGYRFEFILGVAVMLGISSLAPASSGPSVVEQKKEKQPIEAPTLTLEAQTQSAAPAQDQAPPPAAAPDPPPARPPFVAWDGKLLTVDAENSTLMDILIAVRNKTGASMDIPSSAATERVGLHIGPAQVREVLSNLLYGTNFDYIIQAPENDEDGLSAVILTVRGKGDDVVAGATPDVPGTHPATGTANNKGARLMRGWAAPGKTQAQAEAEAALAAEQAAKDTSDTSSSSAPDSSADAASSKPAADGASATESASAGSPPAKTDTSSPTAPAAAASSTDGMTVADIPPNSQTASASPSSSDNGDEFGHKITDMQHMFEQRRQIQAQQNQAQQQPQQQPAAN